MNRRDFLSAAAVTPLVAGLQAPQNPQAGTSLSAELVELTSGDMAATFDRTNGVLHSIRSKSDPLQSNFIGNADNVRRVTPDRSHSMGDLITTVWAVADPEKLKTDVEGRTYQSSGRWQREMTGPSADIRRVSFDDKAFQVEYSGKSAGENSLRSYDLAMEWSFVPEGTLVWDLTLANTTGLTLELGEIAFPFLMNDDYAGLYEGENANAPRDTAAKQRIIHEQKVLAHHYVGGHSSYSLVQRPMGTPPFLFIQPLGDTSFECIYKDGGRGGPDLLAVHSEAARAINRWREPWIHGHSSLVLPPGGKRRYRLSFKFIQDYAEIRDEVYNAGNVGIRIVPSMVVQEGVPTYLELVSKEPLKVEAVSDGIEVQSKNASGHKELITLSFHGRGQKMVRVEYGAGRWTNIPFFCVEDIARLLKTRARFIIERQFYDNPADPYHRHHMFLPYDYAQKTTFTDSEQVWEVGGSDEYGFSEALFLAEKNVHYPSREEVATLETYVTDCLFKYIQNPETYTVRASLYWKARTPSSPWGCWSEKRSESIYRTYNYAHPTNIYYALYKIGKQYGLLTHRTALDYLRMSYRTALIWFTTGTWKHIGVMCGSNSVNLLEDLKKEGWTDEYRSLRAEMEDCDRVMAEDPYPYSSELYIDQTAHEQVYFFTKYFGNSEKNAKTLRVIKALRGGNEPLWFRYGNDRRNFWALWYSESLNGMALLDGFEETGDPDMFIKGFAGVMSVSANLLPDGMGFSEFVWSPDVFAYHPHTHETGQGQWGFMKSARAFVLRDSAFGLIGAGCLLEQTGGRIRIVPKDGLRKIVVYPEKKLRVQLTQGEIDSLTIDPDVSKLELSAVDSTGLVKNIVFTVKGLVPGIYRIRHGGTHGTQRVSGPIELTVPVKDAQSIRLERA